MRRLRPAFVATTCAVLAGCGESRPPNDPSKYTSALESGGHPRDADGSII